MRLHWVPGPFPGQPSRRGPHGRKTPPFPVSYQADGGREKRGRPIKTININSLGSHRGSGTEGRDVLRPWPGDRQAQVSPREEFHGAELQQQAAAPPRRAAGRATTRFRSFRSLSGRPAGGGVASLRTGRTCCVCVSPSPAGSLPPAPRLLRAGSALRVLATACEGSELHIDSTRPSPSLPGATAAFGVPGELQPRGGGGGGAIRWPFFSAGPLPLRRRPALLDGLGGTGRGGDSRVSTRVPGAGGVLLSSRTGPQQRSRATF